MRLMVFDLDTALCQASTMDGLAMASAIFDVTDCHIEPETITSVTDHRALWYQVTGKLPTTGELKTLRERFAFQLRRQFIIRPSIVSANYPMIESVNRLQHRNDTIVAVVTALPQSVLIMKSRAIGLMLETLPVATADDADHLDGILNKVQVRVKRSFGFSRGQAELIGGSVWSQATRRQSLSHTLPEDFVIDHVMPSRMNLFRRANACV